MQPYSSCNQLILFIFNGKHPTWKDSWQHFLLQYTTEYLQNQTKLLHSSTLVVVGLSVGYETWPPIGWHHPLVIGWSKYRLWLPQLQWVVGSHDQWFYTFFQRPLTIPLHSPYGRLPWGLCKDFVKSKISHNTNHWIFTRTRQIAIWISWGHTMSHVIPVNKQ